MNRRRGTSFTVAVAGMALLGISVWAASNSVTVSGLADNRLAGQPNGTVLNGGFPGSDSAPTNSPVLASTGFNMTADVNAATEDDPIYTLQVSGSVIGDFGWSLATAGFITTTTSFNSFLSTSSSAGCTISSVTINNPLSANPFVETFFSPNCPGGGLLFSEVAQTFWNAGPFASTGVYIPLGVVTPPVWTLTITQPPPVPAMPTVGLVIMGLILVAIAAYVLRRRSAPTSAA